MIEIYKKLPRTNCGKCGRPTCMAFAMAVGKSGADLSACPFMTDVEALGQETQTSTALSAGYKEVALEIEKEAVGLDFKEAAEAVGGTYISTEDSEAIRLRMVNKSYVFKKEGLFEDDVYSNDAWARIIICDYIRRRARRPQTGELIGLGYFPNTASHVKAFQANAEKKISAAFKDDTGLLKKRSVELGGTEAPNSLKADYSFRFDLFPNVPLFLFFWSKDEDFDSDCKILFDRSAEDHIDIEYLANLLERFASELAGE